MTTPGPTDWSGAGERLARPHAWLMVCAPLDGASWHGLIRWPFKGLELATAGQLVRQWGPLCWAWLETPCGIVWTYNLVEPEEWRSLIETMKGQPDACTVGGAGAPFTLHPRAR